MDHCGNDAPLLWMVQARGFDLASLRRVESELQRQLRASREEVAVLRRALAQEVKALARLVNPDLPEPSTEREPPEPGADAPPWTN